MRTLDGCDMTGYAVATSAGGTIGVGGRVVGTDAPDLVETTTPVPRAPSTPALAPRAPLEASGRRRDEARLLVASRTTGQLTVATMADLPTYLDPGDVVLVNNSATRPAALVVDDDLVIHLSTQLADRLWTVEPRHLAGQGSLPWFDFEPHGPIALPGGGEIELLAPYRPTRPRSLLRHRPGGSGPAPVRLWTAELRLPHPLDAYLARHGRPIRYGADAGAWPLDAYQTVFAAESGSAEMPSAARGFTAELVTRLVSRGVVVAPLTLHTGVASQEAGEAPYPERYRVPEATAAAANHAHAHGHRVVAVGTTATRAIETVTEADGHVWMGAGWTDLVVTPERGVGVVDGLLTGWHDPEASHLLLVEAVAGGADLLDDSYAVAADHGFAGHEFGDFHLIVP
jgi:S-adenosylmethionine:tRNA ribosyltransferase-isomerase